MEAVIIEEVAEILSKKSLWKRILSHIHTHLFCFCRSKCSIDSSPVVTPTGSPGNTPRPNTPEMRIDYV